MHVTCRDENGTDIFRSYLKPNPFRGVEICLYPSPDIQHLTPYPYPNSQIAYLWCRYPIISYPAWLTLSIFKFEFGQKYKNKYNIGDIRSYPIRFHPYLYRVLCSFWNPRNSERIKEPEGCGIVEMLLKYEVASSRKSNHLFFFFSLRKWSDLAHSFTKSQYYILIYLLRE